jgi:hypothetical protein
MLSSSNSRLPAPDIFFVLGSCFDLPVLTPAHCSFGLDCTRALTVLYVLDWARLLPFLTNHIPSTIDHPFLTNHIPSQLLTNYFPSIIDQLYSFSITDQLFAFYF